MPSSPLLLYSGLFRLNTLTSSFKNGSFTQRLHGNRLPGQENTSEPSKDGLFNLGQVTKDGLAAIGGFFGI